MKNPDHFSEITELIVKSLQEQLSADEAKILETWLEDKENRDLYDSFRHTDLDQKRRQLALLRPDRQWKKIDQRITPRRRKIHLFRYAAAAVLLLGMMIPAYFLFKESAIPEKLPDPMAAIHPGTSKATLTLESGKKITITADQEFSLKETDGINISNSRNNLKIESPQTASSAPAGYRTVSIPTGGEYKIVLEDGTSVWLNSESSLRFPAIPETDKRVVYLEGEGYFEVAPDKKRPFIVCVGDLCIQALGTKFDVKAYPSDHVVYTTLSEGKVRTENRKAGCSVTLQPDQQCLYHKTDKSMEKRAVDADVHIGWTRGRFVFENKPLAEIMKDLERWYNVAVFYQNPETQNYRFTGDIDRFDHISTILDMITKTYNVTFNIQKNTIVVDKKKN